MAYLQSASLELDDSAAIITYEEFHPFGTSSYRLGRTVTEVSQKRYRYVGKERDDESGMYYYGARYYAAWLGRFISVDPLKDKYLMWTSFLYAGNSPIVFIDLNGMGPSNGDVPDVFYTPDGNYVQLPRGATVVGDDIYHGQPIFIQGGNQIQGIKYQSLISFTYQDQQYLANFNAQGNFIGYFGSDGTSLTAEGSTLPDPSFSDVWNANPAVQWLFGDGEEADPAVQEANVGALRGIGQAAAALGFAIGALLILMVAGNGALKVYDYAQSQTSLRVAPKEDPGHEPDPVDGTLPLAALVAKLVAESKEEDEDESLYTYRAMANVGGFPEIYIPGGEGPFSRQLAVREGDVLDLRNADGTVSPGLNKGGLSANRSPTFSDPLINQKVLDGRLTVFKIKDSHLLAMGLLAVPDRFDIKGKVTHVSIQPAWSMSEEDFKARVTASAPLWKIHKT